MGNAAWYLAAAELGRRRRSTVLLALLVALVVGAVLTSVAGARRTGSAVDRYLDEYDGMDLMVPEVVPGLEENPAVETTSTGVVFAVFPAETEGFFPMLVFADGTVPYERMRAPVIEGRHSDPDEPFEVALGKRTSEVLGVGVGDRLPMLSFNPHEADLVFAQGEDQGVEPTGPAFELEVVGIVRDPGDLSGRDSDIALTTLTPAFGAKFSGEIGTIGDLTMVDLAAGATAADLTNDGAESVEVDPAFSRDTIRRQSAPATGALRTGLLALAGALAVAGIVSIGQATARLAHGAAADDTALVAMGCSRTARIAHVIAPGVVAVVVGTVLGALAAVAASPLHPIGVARRADPDLGFQIDLLVLGFGILGALAAGAVAVALAGRHALRPRSRGSVQAGRVVEAAARAGAPASVVAGLQLASDAGGSPRPPVRTAWTAAFAGSLGVLAAVVFASSITRLAASPELYGWGWDLQVAGADGSQVSDGDTDEDDLLADDDLEAVAEVVFALQVTVDGTPVQTMALDDRKGRTDPIIVRGEVPRGPAEIALGGETLDRVGLDVGDEVDVGIEGEQRPFTIVGVVALPVPEDGGLSAEGAVMPWDSALDLGWSGSCEGNVSCFRNYAVSLAPGVDPDVIDERYSSEIVSVDRPVAPGEVQQVQAVDQLPWLLAAFLATLAVVAVAHTAWVTVRRRRRDLTVLRCIGFTGPQLRTTVAVQVAVLVVTGSIIGVLAGVLVGRTLWRLVTDGLSLPFAADIPWIWVVVVPAATLVLAQVVATIPRRAAGRLRAADVLRVE